jgi:hypothetical protein
MSGFPVFIGDDKTGVFTDTNYTDGKTPRAKAWFVDPSGGRKWIFLKNSSATAITEELACMALTTDKTSGFCTLAAATANLAPFAGVRITGATSLANTEWAWFQIGGTATMQAGSDTTTAELGVVTSNQTAGKVEESADTGKGAIATFGIAETTTASADVEVCIFKSVWGL